MHKGSLRLRRGISPKCCAMDMALQGAMPSRADRMKISGKCLIGYAEACATVARSTTDFLFAYLIASTSMAVPRMAEER